MAQDRLTIVNAALGHLGESPIQSLDDGSTAANLARTVYPVVVEEALGNAPWSFAEKVRQLSADAVPLRPDYTFSYERPRDYVAARHLLRADLYLSRRSYKVFGRKICSDEATPWLVYTYTAPEADWLASFSLAVIYAMAHHLAGPITNSAARIEGYFSLYIEQLARARSRDAQQDSPPSFADMDALTSWHTG